MFRDTMISELTWQQNDAITYFSCISWHWNFSSIAVSMLVKFKQNLQERHGDILGLNFYD